MSNQERKNRFEILDRIDAVLEQNTLTMDAPLTPPETTKPAFTPVTQQEVDVFTLLVCGDSRDGNLADRDMLTELKNSAVSLLVKKSENNRYLFNSQESKMVRQQFRTLLAKYNDSKTDTLNATLIVEFRHFRDLALSHILSVNPEILSDELRGKVTGMHEAYHGLEQKYRP